MISIKRPYIENENGKVVCVQRLQLLRRFMKSGKADWKPQRICGI